MKALDYNQIDRIYLAAGHTDLRKGIDGLALIVQRQLQLDPFSRALFLFCGRSKDKIKGLIWEGDGFLLLKKTLSDGKFQWPKNEQEVLELSYDQIQNLLEGLPVIQKKTINQVFPTTVI